MTGSVNATYGFTDKRQTNFATIGEGTITVRDDSDLTGLNRDVTIAQYNTKDGGLQGGFTVDTATVNLIAHPENTVVNTAKAVEKGSLIAYSITEGVVKAATLLTDTEATETTKAKEGLGFAGTLEAVINARKDVLTIVAIAENKALREGIDKALEKDAASLGGAANGASAIIQTSDGVAEGDISKVNLYQGDEVDNKLGEYAACYDKDTNSTYINTEGTDISKGGDIINSLFTEAQRKDNTTNGLDLNSDQQLTLASSRGEQAGNLWNRFSETANTGSSNQTAVNNWNISNASSSTLINGTEKANSLKTGEGSAVVPRIIDHEPAHIVDDEGRPVDTSTNKGYTLQVGINGTIAAVAGITVSTGIAAGYSKNNGLDIGPYITYGYGLYTGPVIGITGEATFSQNDDIKKLEGTNITSGGSIAPLYSIGGQYNHFLDPSSTDSITVNAGGKGAINPLLFPVESHVIVTETEVYSKKDMSADIKNVLIHTSDFIDYKYNNYDYVPGK